VRQRGAVSSLKGGSAASPGATGEDERGESGSKS
jgi:hypothetical protein